MQFGKLRMNPAENPAVLATATWNPEAAWLAVQSSPYHWLEAKQKSLSGQPLEKSAALTPHNSSVTLRQTDLYFLASLPDGQDIFIQIGPGATDLLGTPIGQLQLDGVDTLSVFPADAAVIDRFCRKVAP